jgi:hypothetical protein
LITFSGLIFFSLIGIAAFSLNQTPPFLFIQKLLFMKNLEIIEKFIPAKGTGLIGIGATLAGALAIGSIAVGAIAIGALAIKRMAIKNAVIKNLHVHNLTVDILVVRNKV